MISLGVCLSILAFSYPSWIAEIRGALDKEIINAVKSRVTPERLQDLLGRGADVNAQPYENVPTPLITCLTSYCQEQERNVQVLLSNGADVNRTGGDSEEDLTPLMLAARNGQPT